MARKVFLSFHYKPDSWRVSQIKSIGKIEGTPLLSSNSWEEVKRGGDNIKIQSKDKKPINNKDLIDIEEIFGN